MRVSAGASVLVLYSVLLAHPALCQTEPPAIGNRSTSAEGRIALREETREGKAIFLEADHVIPSKIMAGISEAERKGAPYVHLDGNVVIKMDCFLPTEGTLPVCTVIRADSAKYNERTGDIEATGSVHIKLESTVLQSTR
jgi:lipopolysaccharide assembly outer membrane protein LptD (OstA)